MITKEQAINAQYFHYVGDGDCSRSIGPRGGVTTKVVEVRRNGKTQLWVTRPNEYRIPVKYGIRASGQFSIYHTSAHEYHVPQDCPLNDPKFMTQDLRKVVLVD